MFQKIAQGRMYQKIVDQVFESILSGELKIGQKLPSEKELGIIFGVSRLTVREAIRCLELSGAVEVRQGSTGGAFVKEINLDSIIDQMKNLLRMANVNFYQLATARAFLEEMILSNFNSWEINKRQIAELEESVKKAEQYFKEGQIHIRSEANADFHKKIAQMTGNPVLIMMHELISGLLVDFFKRAKPSDSITKKTLEEHKEIIRLLKDGKCQKAAQLCSRHLKESTLRIAKSYRSQSIFGKNLKPEENGIVC